MMSPHVRREVVQGKGREGKGREGKGRDEKETEGKIVKHSRVGMSMERKSLMIWLTPPKWFGGIG